MTGSHEAPDRMTGSLVEPTCGQIVRSWAVEWSKKNKEKRAEMSRISGSSSGTIERVQSLRGGGNS